MTLSPDTDTPLPDGVTIPSALGAAATATITEDDAATVSLSPLSPSDGGGRDVHVHGDAERVGVVECGDGALDGGVGHGDGRRARVRTWRAVRSDDRHGEFPADSAANATQTFTIATANDDLVEGSETFTVSLAADTLGGTAAAGRCGTVGSDDEATATITEDDAATVSLSPLSPSAAEGGAFTFTATLSASGVGTGDGALDGDGGAARRRSTLSGAGSDLASGQELTGTVEFPANSAANATQTVTHRHRWTTTLWRVPETFTVTLSPDTDTPLPDGVNHRHRRTTMRRPATITEDDAATLSLSPLSPSAAEGRDVHVRRRRLSAAVSRGGDGALDGDIGGARRRLIGAGSDLASGQDDLTATVVFPANRHAANATQTFTIATVNDDLGGGFGDVHGDAVPRTP